MKIFLDTVGCRLNQAEIETLARQFRAAGHEIVPTPAQADLAVINTCTVTGQAASDSRAAIRRANRQGVGQLVVTGCWVTLDPKEAASLQGVCKIIPNQQKENLVSEVLNLPQQYFDLEPLARQPLPGLHSRTRAFIKVQDGCDNACTFCITTVARGPSRSHRLESVLDDIKAALDGGVKEIVLTGVHIGAWGRDFSKGMHLADLISTILIKTSVPRLRLSSLEPWEIDAGFFSLWKDPHMCRHLHLPLQSGSAGVLQRMRRNTMPDAFVGLVESARKTVPGIAITTDIITGFPGETDEEALETLNFVRSIGFAGGHVFSYSARPGTPASRMKDQVSFEIRKQRNAQMRILLNESAKAYQRRFINQTMTVLWEATDQLTDSGWVLHGFTDNYLRISALSPDPMWNELVPVKIDAITDDGLRGNIIG